MNVTGSVEMSVGSAAYDTFTCERIGGLQTNCAVLLDAWIILQTNSQIKYAVSVSSVV